MDPGIAGAVVGSTVGLIGGIIGTYASIKNTHGPRERSFMIKVACACWFAIIAFLLLMFLLPPDVRWLLWIPYAILLPTGILFCNAKQRRIQREEAAATLQ